VPRNPLKRSVDVPADVLGRVRLGRGERVLAAAVTRDGTWLLGTRDALLVETGLPPADMGAGRQESVRIPWQQVERADWDRDTEKLTVLEVGKFGRIRPEYAFEVDDPGLVLDLIRERVTASVVLQRRVTVSGKKGLFVVARRAPHGDSEITWAYEFDRDVDPQDPTVMEAARRGLETAAEELGL